MVALQPRPGLLTPEPEPRQARSAQRYAEVARVLWRVLLLNLLVATAKIAFGAWSGAVSILSDGFHSLTDTASNVVALVGIRLARQPADQGHPYGHRKFETLASAAIFVFLLLVLVEVVRTSISRLATGGIPTVTPVSFGVMGATLVVNLLVVWYEARAAKRLKSELLAADATHTRSDVFTSLTVIAALAGVALGWPILDSIAALVVAIFIGRAGFEIARSAAAILADRVVMDEDELRRVVVSVPGVLGCHHIRTRGTADHIFLDLHAWMRPDMPLFDAHELSHVVKDRLMDQFPALQDVIIHIEPVRPD
ncbi:MAG: cation diffusion facilitator family transporter [Vicinamibacterales bacterium]